MDSELPLLPARMLNEFAYCPRLAYLEWVDGEWAESADTLDGKLKHRRVDSEPKRRKTKTGGGDEGSPEKIHERSVHLSSEKLGLTAKIDLIEGEGHRVTPVDYKRGKRPHVAGGAWEPERVQLCVQGLILREHGHECDSGVLYFAGSKERVAVRFDEELVTRTLKLAGEMAEIARKGETPSPLEDSAKCPRCSLVSICLPDEVRYLSAGAGGEPRPLFPSADDALPFYIQHQGAKVMRDGAVLKVLDREELLGEVPIRKISQLVLFGGVRVTTPVVQELCRRGIPICYLTHGGWFYGMTHGLPHKNVELRRRQYAVAADRERCLVLAKRFVRAKINNSRTLLRRNHPTVGPEVMRGLKADVERTGEAKSLETLLGIEGTAASRYFGNLGGMIKATGGPLAAFDFRGRNRRPPRDPVNALLSLAYAMLARELTVTVFAVGFDPYLGFYHQPRYGRPALALDLMEEFRPLIADSVVLTAINNGEVKPDDFISRMGSVALKPGARARFIRAYERRMGQEVTHPVFGYRVSYRRVLEVQARLLGRYLVGEISEHPSFVTR